MLELFPLASGNPSPPSGEEHLKSSSVSVLEVEYTSTCNLRCTYCPVGKPDYRGAHMGGDVKDAVYKLIDRGFANNIVTLSCVGETTFAPDWMEFSKHVRQKDGVKSYIFTNLARPDYSEEEFDELSRIHRVHFSLDTTDAAVLQQIRRKASVATIGHNIMMIRAAALKRGEAPPHLVCNAMMNSASVAGAETLVYWCIVHGVSEVHFFSLMESVRGDHVENACNAEKLDALSEADALTARETLGRALAALQKHGLACWLDHNIQRFLQPTAPVQVSAVAAAGYTRDCHLPWEHLIVKQNGDIALCCVQHDEILGNILEAGDNPMAYVDDIMHDVRKGIFSGDLPAACRACEHKGMVPVQEFQQRFKS